ncbi:MULTISPECIES: hypothetical protein [Hymenobacter]|uniref:Uncharacterized protein n=1 Tax=Hymenobacter profundi TaxID=1982110 RepID=A0ABS6X2J9_9BACT|nr:MULTISPECIES: hypothetical protein [Hymenobacter]MBW3130038.1 hypothetical protein [Hymenobacter profundi]QNE39436.1 hypothetical protein F1C16_07645 [Hymenobacter sp. NBH84]
MWVIPNFSSGATMGHEGGPSGLPRQYRAWIALYALDANERPRADILRINEVTEADLAEFEASWLQLRCRSSGTLPTRFDLPPATDSPCT